MFSNHLFDAESRVLTPAEYRRSIALVAADQARQLYARVHGRAVLARVWAALTGHVSSLSTLAEIVDRSVVHGQHTLGLQTIALDRVRGSEGRRAGFDAAFRPAQDHMRARWLSVATAMLQGLALPPIDVILVGDHYFVRDGHHRVSVARAIGQVEIEAIVTVWELHEAVADVVTCRVGALV